MPRVKSKSDKRLLKSKISKRLFKKYLHASIDKDNLANPGQITAHHLYGSKYDPNYNKLELQDYENYRLPADTDFVALALRAQNRHDLYKEQVVADNRIKPVAPVLNRNVKKAVTTVVKEALPVKDVYLQDKIINYIL